MVYLLKLLLKKIRIFCEKKCAQIWEMPSRDSASGESLVMPE